MRPNKLNKIAALLAVAGISAPAFATNGMNMEGYGPVATGMGGASFAYDNGTAGMINNPATLGFMKSGTARFDIAIGGLHPDVAASMPAVPAMGTANSGGDAYYMPAAGYVRKDGKLTYGIGMMAQGGMGTEYGNNSFLSFSPTLGGPTGQENRSELGLGRVMFPLAYDVTDSFTVGGSIDYLWGGLDIQMVMDGAAMGAMMAPGGNAIGVVTSTLPPIPMDWAQFDFSKGDNKFTQQLTTNGWALNIGFTWKAAPNLTVGGVYHAKTNLSDMEGSGRLNSSAGPIAGKLSVIDFQWPETYGLGLAYQASDKLLIAADYKRINWADVMKNLRMHFVADGGLGTMDATLYQNWKNQDVFMIGASYKYSPALTLRAGVNLASNPIPDNYLNYLFPATIKDHYALGFGYAFSQAASIDFSYTYAPEVSVTNSVMGIKTTHGQSNNWQFMYSHRF
ncbi:MAG: outer membrane protein transport protein [Sulfuritalea sp.]|nr:outer membrane protein transport protein [Sulfuritalea sp.]